MAIKITRTAGSELAKIRRKYGNAVADAVDSKIAKIDVDFGGCTKAYSHGTRVYDGMLLAEGESFYFRINFSHSNGNTTILLVCVIRAPGPH